MLIKDDDYVYFFHGTNNDDAYSYFRDGLHNFRGADMSSTMWQYSEEMMGENLEEAVKGYANKWGFSNVVVAKIPFRIWAAWNRKGQPYIPLPIWKGESTDEYYGRQTVTLIPQLILGMYKRNKDKGTFIENPNWSTNIDPNGLLYDEKQVDFMRNCIRGDWYDFAVERAGKDYSELVEKDRQSRPFDELIKFYRQRGVIQGSHIESIAAQLGFTPILAAFNKFKQWLKEPEAGKTVQQSSREHQE